LLRRPPQEGDGYSYSKDLRAYSAKAQIPNNFSASNILKAGVFIEPAPFVGMPGGFGAGQAEGGLETGWTFRSAMLPRQRRLTAGPGENEMNRNRIARWVIFALLLMSFSVASSVASFSQIGIGISVRIGPPALPVYTQPICPGPGYLWTPGYWAWSDDDGYYWVPGTWVVAPVGMLWTPGYWGWNEGVYVFHSGYWGPHIGFYGGINYGFGYTGSGFRGGEWRGGNFYYNRSVTNVNVTRVTNVYNERVVVNNTTINRVSYNGGNGGISARPGPQELAAEHEHHEAPIGEQMRHQQAAAQNRELRASVNKGRPTVAATARPADFHGGVPAKAAGAPYHAPKMSPKEARGPAPAANRGGENRGAENRGADNRNGVNNTSRNAGGTRPFTPPSKGNTNNNNRPENNNNRVENKNRPGNTNNSRPEKPENRAEKPNTNRAEKPNNNRPESTARPSENRPSEDRPSENRPSREPKSPSNASRPSNSRPESAPRQDNAKPQGRNESRPQSSPRPEQAKHEAAPKPSPVHQNAAPADRRASAPKQSAPKPNAPRESAPKQDEKRHPGKGR
jgi:hypothetical protein